MGSQTRVCSTFYIDFYFYFTLSRAAAPQTNNNRVHSMILQLKPGIKSRERASVQDGVDVSCLHRRRTSAKEQVGENIQLITFNYSVQILSSCEAFCFLLLSRAILWAPDYLNNFFPLRCTTTYSCTQLFFSFFFLHHYITSAMNYEVSRVDQHGGPFLHVQVEGKENSS